jgi:hypothetical protein
MIFGVTAVSHFNILDLASFLPSFSPSSPFLLLLLLLLFLFLLLLLLLLFLFLLLLLLLSLSLSPPPSLYHLSYTLSPPSL